MGGQALLCLVLLVSGHALPPQPLFGKSEKTVQLEPRTNPNSTDGDPVAEVKDPKNNEQKNLDSPHYQKIGQVLDSKYDALVGSWSGQVIIGYIVGAGIGTVTAASTVGLSGGDPDGVDRMGFMMAGGIGGAAMAYTFDASKQKKADIVGSLSKPAQERFDRAKYGFEVGGITGLIGGAIASVWSGSSDDGASSQSSGSSKSSSSTSGEPAGATAQDSGGETQTTDPNLPSSIVMSGNMPIIHNIIAGAVGGGAAAYFEPEIMHFGGAVGKGAVSLVKKATKHATNAAKDQLSSISDGSRSLHDRMKSKLAEHRASLFSRKHSRQAAQDATETYNADPITNKEVTTETDPLTKGDVGDVEVESSESVVEEDKVQTSGSKFGNHLKKFGSGLVSFGKGMQQSLTSKPIETTSAPTENGDSQGNSQPENFTTKAENAGSKLGDRLRNFGKGVTSFGKGLHTGLTSKSVESVGQEDVQADLTSTTSEQLDSQETGVTEV